MNAQEELIVDTTELEKAGFVILSREEGERRSSAMKQYLKTRKEVWPVEETAFNPRGVTIKEARAAMKLCMENQ